MFYTVACDTLTLVPQIYDTMEEAQGAAMTHARAHPRHTFWIMRPARAIVSRERLEQMGPALGFEQ